MKRLNNKGFTIIEMMIATIVFSVTLLIMTAAIIQFGKIYYKGTVQARTQQTVRTALQDISQSIQFGPADPVGPFSDPSGVQYYCIGTNRLTFLITPAGTQLGTGPGQSAHILVSDSSPSCSAYPAMNTPALPSGARELIGEKMQLTDLQITKIGSDLYQITIAVAYGQTADLEAGKKSCKALTLGGQFCAVSQLTTTVQKRF